MKMSLSRRVGAEFIGTFWLVFVGCGSAVLAAGFSRLGIGFTGVPLAFGLLASIPVTNTSVNPARSTGPALFVGGWAIEQLWLFWLAPIAGGVLGGLLYRGLVSEAAASQLAEVGRGLKIGTQEVRRAG